MLVKFSEWKTRYWLLHFVLKVKNKMSFSIEDLRHIVVNLL